MKSKRQRRSSSKKKQQNRQMVAAGRRLDGIWNVTTYLPKGSTGGKQGLFWQKASCQ